MYVCMYVCMYEKTVVVMWYLKCLAAVLRPVHVVEVFDDPTRARSNERDRRLSQERERTLGRYVCMYLCMYHVYGFMYSLLFAQPHYHSMNECMYVCIYVCM